MYVGADIGFLGGMHFAGACTRVVKRECLTAHRPAIVGVSTQCQVCRVYVSPDHVW